MTAYIAFVLRLRWLVITIFCILTLLFSAFFLQATIQSSPSELFFGDSPQYLHYLDRASEFGGDMIVVIAVQEADLVSKSSLARLEKVVETIEDIPEVVRVESLISAQHIESVADELFIDRYVELFRRSPERKNELLEELTSDPLTRNMLITRDSRNSAIIIEFVPTDASVEATPQAVDTIIDIFQAEGFHAENLYRGGLIAVLAEVVHQAAFNLQRILPITVIVLILFVYAMFRRIWPVLMTFIITGMAVVWTMGLAVMLYGHINIFTTMIPALILITCFADVVHLYSAYLMELSSGREKRESILLIGREVGTACGYTSLTTFCGFVSMTLVPTPMFRQMGLLMGFGVAIALFTALTLVPIFLSLLQKPKSWRSGSVIHVQGILDRILVTVTRLTARYPGLVVIVFGFLLAISLYGFSQIHFETQLTKRFDPDNPIRFGLQYFQQTFPGTNPLDIYIDTDDAEGIIDPQRFQQLATLEQWIEDLPQVSQAVSIVDLVRKLYMEINPEMAASQALPPTKAALAQLLLLFEISGGDDLNRLITSDYQTARINVRMKDIGIIETALTGQRIVHQAHQLLGPSIMAEALSFDLLLGDWLEEIIRGQRSGLIFAVSTIAILMIVAMRSIRNGLLSMIPNMLPLLVLLGYMGFFWEQVDTDTMAIMMVAIGIGVDDTIHFLVRLKQECQKGNDIDRSIRRAMDYAGRAIIMTSVILVGGFAPFALSDYFSLRIFGTLLPLSLVVALMADLFLVPAMAKLGWLRFYSHATAQM